MHPSPHSHGPGDGLSGLYSLAALAGVQTEYHDITGRLHRASAEALRAVLGELGPEDASGNLVLEPVIAIFEDEQPLNIPARILLASAACRLTISITDEQGREMEYRRLELVLPPTDSREKEPFTYEIKGITRLPLGYYDLSVRAEVETQEAHASARIIIAPRMCHLPKKPSWGLTLSLYSVRSRSNWGIGDLGDLRRIMESCRKLGAGFAGINPLHSTPNSEHAGGISPYQPITRLYLNHIYADASALDSPAAADIEEARASEFVSYDQIARIKTDALAALHEKFSESATDAERSSFEAFCREEGRALEDYATFMALGPWLAGDLDGDVRPCDWRTWPEPYRLPSANEVSAFRSSHAREVEFHKFVQWTLARQLQGVRAAGRGVSPGLYGDLAVGSAPGGSDTWSNREVYALETGMGAPPDDFSPTGQNWFFPPWSPRRLRQSGYEMFIRTIRANMRHYGALRIDHALGLFRTFWVPSGMEAGDGVYVESRHDEMLKIIALESVRNRTVVIAEDLGTVGPGVRETLASYGMLSYRLLYFERHWDRGQFMEPGQYPALSLSAVNTHDLPTLCGFIEGADINERRCIGIYCEDGARGAHDVRRSESEAMMRALAPWLPSGAGQPRPDDIVLAAYAFISETPSLMRAVNVEDLMMLRVQQNLPGTDSGHPNWKRRYPAGLDGILGSEMLRKIAAKMNRGA